MGMLLNDHIDHIENFLQIMKNILVTFLLKRFYNSIYIFLNYFINYFNLVLNSNSTYRSLQHNLTQLEQDLLVIS